MSKPSSFETKLKFAFILHRIYYILLNMYKMKFFVVALPFFPFFPRFPGGPGDPIM